MFIPDLLVFIVMIIYKTTNLINGKIYIGKDRKNSNSYLGSGVLLKKAIQKYGIENFKKEILEFCINDAHLNEREIFWINEYKSFGEGYNLTIGGSGGITRKSKPIYQYSLQGFFIKEWISGAEIERILSFDSSSILKVCKGKLLTFKNYLWSYIKSDKLPAHIDPRGIKLLQYDFNGNFIREWLSAHEVQRELNINHANVLKVTKNISQKIGGYYWREKINEEILKTIKIEDDKRKRKGTRGKRGKYKKRAS